MNTISNECAVCIKEQLLTQFWLDQVSMQNAMVLFDLTSSSFGSRMLTFLFGPNTSDMTYFTQIGNTAAKIGTGRLLVKI